MPSFYDLPQAPRKYEDAVIKAGSNIYEHMDEDHEWADTFGFVCGIPVIPFAYLVCTYMIFEGLVLLLSDLTHFGLSGGEAFLEVVAWGDLLVAVVGATGIWFSYNLLPIGWRRTSNFHSSIAALGAGVLLSFRTLVCFAFAPWVGIILAFHTPSTDKAWWYILAISYSAFSIFLVYVLVMAYREAVCSGRRFQLRLDAQALPERRELLTTAGHFRQNDPDADDQFEVHLFGCLPLVDSIMLYTIVIAIGCLWAFIHLVFTGHTSGGWAFFGQTSQVSTTFWLEVLLWPLSFACALIGIAGTSSFMDYEKPTASSIQSFLVGSIVRYGSLFAVTGMNLVQKNTCGFYLDGLARLASTSYSSSASAVMCQPTEYLFLAAVLACCLLDGYLIWGTFQLWQCILAKGRYGAMPIMEDQQ